MALLSASNDTSYYVGSTTNQTYTDSETAIWRLKSLLKTAGWTVAAFGKGTGAAVTGLYSDPFTSASLFYTGAVETSNTSRAKSWFIIVQPGTSRSFSFQHENASVQSTNWRVKYSPGGFSLTGTLSSAATPGPITNNDEYVFVGTGTDAAPTPAVLFEVSTRIHAVAQNTAPYGFWMGAYVISGATNAGNGRTAIALDPLLSGSYSALDLDPYVAYIRFGNNGSNVPTWRVDTMSSTTIGPAGSIARGLSQAQVGVIPAMRYSDAGSNTVIPAGVVTCSFDANDELFPIPYARHSLVFGAGGFKGISTFFKWNGFARNGGDTVTTTVSGARDYICLAVSGACALWTGEVVTP